MLAHPGALTKKLTDIIQYWNFLDTEAGDRAPHFRARITLERHTHAYRNCWGALQTYGCLLALDYTLSALIKEVEYTQKHYSNPDKPEQQHRYTNYIEAIDAVVVECQVLSVNAEQAIYDEENKRGLGYN